MNRVATALTALLLLSACTDAGKDTPTPEPVRPVLSTVVKEVEADRSVLVGTVEPQISAELSFRLLGRVISRDGNVGDTVKKGVTLASLDPAALQLQLQGARANLASAQAQAANATASEERQRQLLEARNTPQAVYDAAKQARDTANAGVEQAQAAVAKAEEQLGYAQLSSDFDGVVTAVGAEVGQTVSPGQMIITVARADQRDAVIDMPDQVAAALQVGTQFTVVLQSAPNITATATVREIAPQSDAATRTRRVKLALPQDASPSFRLGSTVSAASQTEGKASIRLPDTAIRHDGDKTYVWVVENAVVQPKQVQLSSDGGGTATIASGLDAGARVVTAGVNSLKPGQTVRVDAGEAIP